MVLDLVGIVIVGLSGGRRCAFARGSGRGGRMALVWRRGGKGKALKFRGLEFGKRERIEPGMGCERASGFL